MGFVHRKGRDFYLDNSKITFRGVGVGSWLNMEHFMLGLPTTHSGILRAFDESFGKEDSALFYDHFVTSFLNDDDMIFMKKVGINLIRVPFNYRLFIDDSTEMLINKGFQYFDYLVHLCHKHKIYLLPDLHAAPGGQNPDWHSDNQTGMTEFWHYKIFQDQMIYLWKEIAKRYQDEEYILGYDLLNEPFLIPNQPGQLQEFYDELIVAIRQVDHNHLLFIEGDHFAMDFSCITHLNDEQTALAFHYYPTVWDSSLDRADFPRQERRDIFDQQIKKMIDSLKRFDRPMICGEAGYDIAGHSLAHVMEMVEDTLDMFEKYDISWTLWCYKDAQFMGIVYPKETSPWMKFVNQIHQSWTHYWEMEKGNELVETMSLLFKNKASKQLKYELQFSQRSLLSILQREELLKPLLQEWGHEQIKHLPESFLFCNCEYYTDYARLLQKYTKSTFTID